ncbi:keratinocyte differentiation factor 1 [Dryobates pubescens]|uniref:keratinocyte differentiation factor 1 n=1 Tax=Dryobates pubescens TaxID=118200 RepID=UPI0023B8B11F|nr:keratinocyte differentiation factor 1 [Dryobates pubescens]
MLGREARLPHELNSRRQPRQPCQEAVPLRPGARQESDGGLEALGGSAPEARPGRRAQPARGRRSRRAEPREAKGREAETVAFIPGAAEAAPGRGSCCSSLSQAWSTYKAVFCCILTCGSRFRDCGVCVPQPGPAEAPCDEGKNGDCKGRPAHSPGGAAPAERNGSRVKKSSVGSSFSYPDVKLKGIPVYPNRSPGRQPEPEPCCPEPPAEKARRGGAVPAGSPRGSEEYYSFHESDLEAGELGGSMSSRQIDVLIFRKLTELFSVHQIDELAKCTSDTVFLEKTTKISDLINSITQDYNLDEQDAECRLVRGIIRISTRKSRARPPPAPQPAADPAPESLLLSQDDLAVQISEETPADVLARNMRRHSSAGSPSRDSSFQDTETDSSGAPLLQVYC